MGKTATHPKYDTMVIETLTTLRDKKGTSRYAIKAYIGENYEVAPGFQKLVTKSLKKLEDEEEVGKVGDHFYLTKSRRRPRRNHEPRLRPRRLR
jgi:hypothetical protein